MKSAFDRWLEISGNLSVYTIIRAMYQDRCYHNINHIVQCLEEYDLYCEDAQDDDLKIAIWFHDLVYTVGREDNEERSIQHTIPLIKKLNCVSESKVKRLILATKHNKDLKNEDEQLIADLDLSVLGQGYGAYRQYQEAIYREYKITKKNWSEFAKGRVKVLEKLLAKNKGRIYYLDYFHKKCGENAFTDINRELIELKRDEPPSFLNRYVVQM